MYHTAVLARVSRSKCSRRVVTAGGAVEVRVLFGGVGHDGKPGALGGGADGGVAGDGAVADGGVADGDEGEPALAQHARELGDEGVDVALPVGQRARRLARRAAGADLGLGEGAGVEAEPAEAARVVLGVVVGAEIGR